MLLTTMTAINIENRLDSYHGCLPEMPSLSDSLDESRSVSWRKSKVVVAVSPFIPTENSVPAPDKIRRNKPPNFWEIKKKLAFDEDDIPVRKEEELDFTDKLAALRSLFITKQSPDFKQSRRISSSTREFQDQDISELVHKRYSQSDRSKDFSTDLKNRKQNDNLDRMKFKDIEKFSVSDFSTYNNRSNCPNVNEGRQYIEYPATVSKAVENTYSRDTSKNKTKQSSSQEDYTLKGRKRSNQIGSVRHSSLETADRKSDFQNNLKFSRRSHSSNVQESSSYAPDKEELNTNNSSKNEQNKRQHIRTRSERKSQIGNRVKIDENIQELLNSPRKQGITMSNYELVQSNLSSFRPQSPAKGSISDHNFSRTFVGQRTQKSSLSNTKDISESVYVAELLHNDSCYFLSGLDGKQTNVEHYVGTSPSHKMLSSGRANHHNLDSPTTSPESKWHSSLSPTRRRQTLEKNSSNVPESKRSSSVSPTRKKPISGGKPLMDSSGASFRNEENRHKKSFVNTSIVSPTRGRNSPKRTRSDRGKFCVVSPDKPLTLEELSDPRKNFKGKDLQSNIKSAEDSDVGSQKFTRHKQKYLEQKHVSISKLKSFSDELREYEGDDCSRSDSLRTFEDSLFDVPGNMKKNRNNTMTKQRNIWDATGKNILVDSFSLSSKSDVSVTLNKNLTNWKQSERRASQKEGSRANNRIASSFTASVEVSSKNIVNQGGKHTEESGLAGENETLLSSRSLTSTIHSVHFLRRLYQVDDATRNRLILQAKCFWRWRKTVQKIKKKCKENYVVMQEGSTTVSSSQLLNSAIVFRRRRLIVRYYLKWKNSSHSLQKFATASALHRHHLMRKGLQALMFAINRSKLQQDMLIKKIQIIQKSTVFIQWRNKAWHNRRQRLASAFQRWHEFTMEAQRFRLLRRRAEKRVLIWAIDVWKESYQERLQEKRAYLHYRRLQLVETIRCWKAFTVTSKEKKQKQRVSLRFHNKNLRRKTFKQMKVVYGQYQKAKKHHRRRTLHQMLLAWKQGSYVLRTERQRDMSTSKEHWRLTTVRTRFVSWHEKLLLKRACIVSDISTKRYTLRCWRARWIQRVQMQKVKEAEQRQELLYTCLRNFFCNVQALKRRRQLAIKCVEKSLMHHTLYQWITYTQNRSVMRRNLLNFMNKIQRQKKKKYLSLWRTRLQVQLDKIQARKTWSNSCVRKASDQWMKVCHRRRLENLLEASEPLRELQQQKVMFERWLAALNQKREEKKEAHDAQSLLQYSCLQRNFQKWRLSTQYMLIIKPLLQRTHRQIVTRVFDSWLDFVKHKATCRRNQKTFQRMLMRRSFGLWRRQYLVHQLEIEVVQKTLQCKVKQCLLGWHFVIQRKHIAKKFHNKQLVHQAFIHWSARAVRELRKKSDAKEKEVEKRSILGSYFNQWLIAFDQQKAHNMENVLLIQQVQMKNRLQLALITWRRHFRATILARENHRILDSCMMRQVLLQWRNASKESMLEAVHVFASRLGLQCEKQISGNASGTSSSGFHSNKGFHTWADSVPEQFDQLGDFESEGDVEMFLSQGCSPQSSAMGTPIRRLFSPALSRMSPRYPLDFEHLEKNHPALLSNTLLDAKFAMEQAVRTDRLRNVVTRVITKLKFWPLSVVFDQWKEFTHRQSELQAHHRQLSTLHQHTVQKLFFTNWRIQQTLMIRAKLHRNKVLQKRLIRILLAYRKSRQEKQRLSHQAERHYAHKVYNQILPLWRAKNESRQYKKRIVHLWSNTTSQEQLLAPLEHRIRSRLTVKTVRLCFTVWIQQYQQRARLKLVVHRILVQRCFDGWKTWAIGRRERRLKSVEFTEKRLQSQAFKAWQTKLKQKLEVERLHEKAWSYYLCQIVTSWQQWATVTSKHRMLAKQIVQNSDSLTLNKHFYSWKTQVQKNRKVMEFHQNHVQLKFIKAWHRFSMLQKDLKKRLMIFQITQSLRLGKQTFRMWRESHLQRMHDHQEHDQQVRQQALHLGQMWRRKAQTTRGEVFSSLIEKRRVKMYFEKWRAAHARNDQREEVLTQYIMEKNQQLVTHYLNTWRSCLLSAQVKRLYNTKLVSTILMEWHVFAVESKELRLSCETVQKLCKKGILRSFFKYWSSATQVQVSVKQNYSLKLQIQTIREWHHYAQKKKMLQQLQTAFLYQHNYHIRKKTWQQLCFNFRHCQNLANIADKLEKEKNMKCLRQTLDIWEHGLNCGIADRYYRHLVTVKAISKWQNFVHRRKQERHRMQNLVVKSKNHFKIKISKQVMDAWYSEVLVSRQIQKHKLKNALKFGLVWRLRVNQQFTAVCMNKERQIKLCWKQWRLAFIEKQAILKMEKFEQNQLLARTFGGWRRSCRRKKKVKRHVNNPAAVHSVQFLDSVNPTSQQLDEQTNNPSSLNSRPSMIPSLKYSVKGPQTSGSNGRFRARPVIIRQT